VRAAAKPIRAALSSYSRTECVYTGDEEVIDRAHQSLIGLAEQARRSSWVTHQHPEVIAGTIAVASADAWAWHLAGHATISPADFLDRVSFFVSMNRQERPG
jgi:hypothetical protein